MSLKPTGDADDGGHRYEGMVPLSRTGAFGYDVRVLPRHAHLATPAELGLVAVPLTRPDGLPSPAWA